MASPNFFILYVDDPAASATFYSTLLERPPVESSANFVLFALDAGAMLGLWSKHTVDPAPPGGGSGSSGEFAFALETDESVTALHGAWAARGIRIAQPPSRREFGYTFLALDPDGHRLRAFSPAAAASPLQVETDGHRT